MLMSAFDPERTTRLCGGEGRVQGEAMDSRAWNARAKELRRQARLQDPMGRNADISALVISVMLAAASIAFPFYAALAGMELGWRGARDHTWQSNRFMIALIGACHAFAGVILSRLAFHLLRYWLRILLRRRAG